MIDFIRTIPQYLVPQHALSRGVAALANCQTPWIKNTFIRWFIQRYHVNMQEAVIENPENYQSFNEFFTRQLKPGIRLINNHANTLISPVDGTISEMGPILSDQILQAKKQHYTLAGLLGDKTDASHFYDGQFITIYLAPKDYHRIHMPIDGTLKKTRYIPGKLFSVNPRTTRTVNNLFARNERLVTLFDTAAGKMAIVLVGAMIVAGIRTVWDNTNAHPISIARGEQMGHFELGSTVILLFEKNTVQWETILQANHPVLMGQSIATHDKLA